MIWLICDRSPFPPVNVLSTGLIVNCKSFCLWRYRLFPRKWVQGSGQTSTKPFQPHTFILMVSLAMFLSFFSEQLFFKVLPKLLFGLVLVIVRINLDCTLKPTMRAEKSVIKAVCLVIAPPVNIGRLSCADF